MNLKMFFVYYTLVSENIRPKKWLLSRTPVY
jgi:hypothetical protein